MKWTVAILSLVIVLACFAGSPSSIAAQTPQQNSAARALYNEGRDLMDDGKLSEAEKKFREVIGKYPKSDSADDASFYLITALTKLGRASEARAEVDGFRKTYPQSPWTSDVEERRIALGTLGQNTVFPAFQPWTIQPAAPVQFPNDGRIYQSGEHRYVFEPGRNDLHEYYVSAFGGSTPASLNQEILRVIIEKDPDRGIELAQERLKADPSDPAVISNLSTIANSNSPKALPFIMSLAKTSTVPNVRTQSLFWMSRKNGDKDVVVKALMELLAASEEKETEVAVANTFAQFNNSERRAALEQIAQSTNAKRLAMLERIYKNSNNTQVRVQIVESVASLTDARALSFLGDAARNDREMSVRRAAVQALATRKEPEALKTLEDLLKTPAK